MKLDVISLDNKKSGSVDLDEAIFGLDVRSDLLARAVNWQLAKRRQGTHAVKGRTDVSGGGKNPYLFGGTASYHRQASRRQAGGGRHRRAGRANCEQSRPLWPA